MWELIQADHQGALTALVTRESKDLVLVSKDGGKQTNKQANKQTN